jgi:hypothetical protein
MLGTAYPLASEGALDAVLSERDRPDGERRPIPRAAWSFVAPGGGAAATEITLDGGFKPGRIYELTYTARDPMVVAAGMAGIRDVRCPSVQGVQARGRSGHLQNEATRLPVGRVRRVVCASTQYLRRHGLPRVPDDVRRHSCVRHVGLVPRSEWHFRVGKRQVTIPIASIMTCNEIDSAINACTDSLGLGMFLSYMVAPYRKAGQLKYVLEEFETEPMPVQVVYPQARLMSHKVRTFVDECVGKLRRTAFD